MLSKKQKVESILDEIKLSSIDPDYLEMITKMLAADH
jgi:hypothetical protein